MQNKTIVISRQVDEIKIFDSGPLVKPPNSLNFSGGRDISVKDGSIKTFFRKQTRFCRSKKYFLEKKQK
jgi:hypothetical protein